MNLKDRYFLYYNLIQHHLHLKHALPHDRDMYKHCSKIFHTDEFR